MKTIDWRARDALLLPDSGRWGRGYGGKAFTLEDMDETAGYIAEARQAGQAPVGYGPRLFTSTPGFRQLDGGDFILPSGYDARRHQDREGADPLLLEPDTPTSSPDDASPWQVPRELQELYRLLGYGRDQNGRACNPHGLQLSSDTRIGLNTNLGSGYEGGEAVVVDVVVDDGRHVLFNTREDLGRVIPSLTGGYSWATDYGVTLEEWRSGNRPVSAEGIFVAARRIVKMKTGVALPDDAVFTIAWAIRPASSRHTWNFWTVTYTVLVQIESGLSAHLNPSSNEGTPMGIWHPKRTINEVVADLWPDHRRGFAATQN